MAHSQNIQAYIQNILTFQSTFKIWTFYLSKMFCSDFDYWPAKVVLNFQCFTLPSYRILISLEISLRNFFKEFPLSFIFRRRYILQKREVFSSEEESILSQKKQSKNFKKKYRNYLEIFYLQNLWMKSVNNIYFFQNLAPENFFSRL